jgi:dihydroneopterin aldolase/2-amino-4-hydroxy-6-hydroxymethyldihydropteridine diphosphokinase
MTRARQLTPFTWFALGKPPATRHDDGMSVSVTPYVRHGKTLDSIVLEGIRATGFHGVHPSERSAGQLFVADVVVHLDTRLAARSDKLARTVDYSVVADQVAAVLAGEPLNLLEAVAERIAGAVLEHDLVVAVDVTVHKPQAPLAIEFGDVGVTLRRDIYRGDLWSDKRIGSSAGLPDDPRLPEAVPEPQDALDHAPAQPVPVLLAVGGNVGDTEHILAQAIVDLDRIAGVRVLAVSPHVVSKPVGGPEQPDFHNAVVRAETALSPRALLNICQGIEMVHGRERSVENGPRTLDIDIIQFADVAEQAEDLVIPHPRAHQRAFVLAPWAAMEPDAALPEGRVAELAAAAPDAAGVAVASASWEPLAVLRSRGAASSS